MTLGEREELARSMRSTDLEACGEFASVPDFLSWQVTGAGRDTVLTAGQFAVLWTANYIVIRKAGRSLFVEHVRHPSRTCPLETITPFLDDSVPPLTQTDLDLFFIISSLGR